MRRPILRNQQDQSHPLARDYSPQPAAPPPRFVSARSSYPVFLSFHDTLKLQIGWAWRGLVDAFRWDVVISLMTRNVCLFFLLTLGLSRHGSCFLFDSAAMPRSAPTRSSHSCSTASPSSRSTFSISSCTPCRRVRKTAEEERQQHARETGFIGASGGSIASCGFCPSSASRSISTCVKP